jgi:hypothetical protein
MLWMLQVQAAASGIDLCNQMLQCIQQQQQQACWP